MDIDKSEKLMGKYLEEAGGWSENLEDMATVHRDRYFLLSLLAVIVALVAVVAVAGLTPLKTSQPYLYEVDTATGSVTAVKRIDMTQYTPPDVVTMEKIATYLIARESVDRQDQRKRYVTVQRLSSKEVAAEYVDFMENSPRSPLVAFKEKETRTVYIRDMVNLGNSTFHLEIETRDVKKNLTEPIILYWALAVTFRYINMPSDSQYRFDNPLGFQVTRYIKDQKIIRKN